MECGSRTIPATIDYLASKHPEKTWVQYALSSKSLEERQPLAKISFACLANSVNRLAHFLSKNIPSAGNLETTICYLGPSDIRYFILACAATKARVKLLLSSPRNNLEAHKALFEQAGCRTLLGTPGMCESLADSCDMQHYDMLSLEDVLNKESVEAFRWHSNFHDIRYEPFVILHTSGSTGNPKMVEISHELITTIDAQQLLPDVDGQCVTSRLWKDSILFAAMPLFHSAGFNILSFSLFQGTQVVLGPSDGPPCVSTVEHILEMGVADAGLIPPSLLAEIANEPSILPKLAKWKSVSFGGGPLAESAATSIWKYTKVMPLLGSTETFNIPELLPQADDEVPYHRYHPSLGISFEPVSGGLCELVFHRKVELARHQGAFCTFRDLQEYRMKDLYEEHPSKPGLWKYKGRLDDVVVLSNGEKWNPCGAEQILAQHSEVRSALIVGTGHEQPLLLVEPTRRGSIDHDGLLDTEELRLANTVLPAYAQIDPAHIRIVEPETFLRSGKGEVRRRPTVDMLEDEINTTYAKAEVSDTYSSSLHLDFSSPEKLVASLLAAVISDILPDNRIQGTFMPEDDMFQFGVDSQRVISLTRLLRSESKAQDFTPACQISSRLIYNKRTIAGIVASIMANDTDSGYASEEDNHNSCIAMSTMLAKFTAALPTVPSHNTTTPQSSRQVFLLTGSTGSLGSYILNTLLRRYPDAGIICLNRPGSDLSRQAGIQKSRGLTADVSHVKFLQCHAAEPQLGLDSAAYRTLQSATTIIHNAWPVNFNLPLSAFSDQLTTCNNLINLAHSIEHATKLIFCSSVGAANHWLKDGNTGPVPETSLPRLQVAETCGYAQSKLLAEHLFSRASERLGDKLSLTICRLGQIAGPVTLADGCWNPQEWFPSILSSSKVLGMLPETLGAMNDVDWIPVDVLADVLVDVCAGSIVHDTADVYYNMVNPSKIAWGQLAPRVCQILGPQVRLVPFVEWVQAVATSMEEDSRTDLPAVKLLDFYMDISRKDCVRPLFAVGKSLGASERFAALEAISDRWMECWVRQLGVAKSM